MEHESFERQLKNPYYIVAPAYIRTSAGIRVLHLLCHYLNLRGERAYIIPHPSFIETSISPDLFTPQLTQNQADSDFKKRLCPIVIYPETISGNPLKAPFVIRYLLNFPGLLGGDKEFGDDFILSYSQLIQEEVKKSDCTLFIPVSDPSLFKPIEGAERKGTCFYASKYKVAHAQKTFDITKDSFEITRNEPNSLTQPEVANLLAHSELFYCYENSSMIIESILCGCPVVILNNPYFDKLIGKYEYGEDGIAFDTKPESIEKAKQTVHLARERYLNLLNDVDKKLDCFISLTQNIAKNKAYKEAITVKNMSLKNSENYFLKNYKKILTLQYKFYLLWEFGGISFVFQKMWTKLNLLLKRLFLKPVRESSP